MPFLSDLTVRFGGELIGDDVQINGVASLHSATADKLTFFDSSLPPPLLAETQAAAVLLNQDNTSLTARPRWVVANPRLCFARVAAWLNPPPSPPAGIVPTAVVAATATLGKNTAIGDNAVIGDGCVIGDNTVIHTGVVVGDGSSIGDNSVLYPRVVLYPQVRIGDSCILHAGVVVGGDGFGYVADENKEQQKIPQLGTVRMGNNVEIGANSAIDRGTLDDTVIGNGVKIDNLVQIGHNVHIGDGSIICGNVGVAGSATIGAQCVIGGGAGIAGHIRIGDRVRVAGHSAVTHNIAADSDVMSVWPAMPARQWRRVAATVRRLAVNVKKRNSDSEK